MATTIPATTFTYSEDLKWQPVGPLDENGKGVFVSPAMGPYSRMDPPIF